jgi:hypothetical protein
MLKRILGLLGYVLLVFSLCSCDESKVPLSEPKASFRDESIRGVWHARQGEDDLYLHIIPTKPPLMKLVKVFHANGKDNYGNSNFGEFEMFPTLANGKKFMNLKYFRSQDPNQSKSPLEPRYTFLMYDLTKDNMLNVWQLDYETWKAAFAAKRLKGNAWETTWGSNVSIEDTSENILKFLLSEDTQNQFRLLG